MVKSSLILFGAACSLFFASCAKQESSEATPRRPRIAAPLSGVDSTLYPRSAPKIYAQSAILIDARSGKVLYHKNPDSRRAVASTQKLLTALVVLGDGNMSKAVTITPHDTRVEPVKLYIKPGQVYSRRQLLNAFLIRSPNDVARTLARDNAGSISAFANKMNAKARQLGATSSNFVNPHGLTEPGQYSTARDVARIAFHAYRNRTIRQIVCTTTYSFRFSNGKRRTLYNTNRLLFTHGPTNGMKTGFTNAAGRCLVSSATLKGDHVILVQLGSKTKYIWPDGAKLMDWGLNKLNRPF